MKILNKKERLYYALAGLKELLNDFNDFDVTIEVKSKDGKHEIIECYQEIEKYVVECINNIQPYKFEDLEEGMWVWDNRNKKCIRIYGMVKKKDWFMCVTEHKTLVTWYEENRFFPVQYANVRCE